MSSLQCPATLLLVACPDPATPEPASGPTPTEELAARVARRRVAAVWSGTSTSALRAGEELATSLGCSLSVRSNLDPLHPEDVVGEAATRLREVLQEVADLHRGETVLIVSHADLLTQTLPRFVRTPPHATSIPPAGVVELEVDDEWWCRSWDRGEPSADAPPAAP